MSHFGTFVGAVPIKIRPQKHIRTSYGNNVPEKLDQNITGKSLTPLAVTDLPQHYGQPDYFPPNHNLSDRKPIKAPRPQLHIKAMWPFDLFPNELFIDDCMVILHEHYFFYNDAVTTMLVANIANCQVFKALSGAQLRVNDKYGTMIDMKWLKPKDAQEAKTLLEELMLGQHRSTIANQIDDDASIRFQLTRYFEQLKVSSS